MADIKEYEAGISAEAPLPGSSPERLRATADSFGGGPGLEDLGKSVDNLETQLYDVEQRQEVSKLDKDASMYMAQRSTQLKQDFNSGAVKDPTYEERFMQETQDHLADMQSGIYTAGGQKQFGAHEANILANSLSDIKNYKTAYAGIEAKQDFLSARSADAITIFNNPAMLKDVNDAALGALSNPDGIGALMDPKDRMELMRTTTENNGLAALRGAIELNPSMAEAQLKAGTWDKYLTGAAREHADQMIQTAKNGQLVDEQRALIAQERQERMASKADYNTFINKIGTDPTSVTAKDIIDSKLLPEQKEQWLNPKSGLLVTFAKESDEDRAKYGVGFSDALQNIYAEDGNPKKIVSDQQISDLYTVKAINYAGFQALKSNLDSKTTQQGSQIVGLKKDFFLTANKAIVSPYGVAMPQNQEKYNAFYGAFSQEFQHQVDDEHRSPVELLTPGSKHYLGYIIDKYKSSTMTQAFESMRVGANPEVVSKAKQTKYNAAGQAAYLVDGAWVDGSGKPVGTAPASEVPTN